MMERLSNLYNLINSDLINLCYISLLSVRLILIAEKDTVYEKFPTPLINRLEKHFVLTSSVLEDWQKNLLVQCEDWIKKFSDTG